VASLVRVVLLALASLVKLWARTRRALAAASLVGVASVLSASACQAVLLTRSVKLAKTPVACKKEAPAIFLMTALDSLRLHHAGELSQQNIVSNENFSSLQSSSVSPLSEPGWGGNGQEQQWAQAAQDSVRAPLRQGEALASSSSREQGR